MQCEDFNLSLDGKRMKPCRDNARYACVSVGERNNENAKKHYFCHYHATHGVYVPVKDLQAPEAEP